MEGGAGVDFYNAGGGSDRIVFNSVAEIGKGKTASTRETVAHFDSGSHVLDFKAVDANGAGAGNGTFVFVGTDAFSGVAGELRYEVVNGPGVTGDRILIEGDVTGDAVADFRIQLTNFQTLVTDVVITADHFVL